MGYKQELDALGRWVYQKAGLRSYRLDSSPPKVARPVILWEIPNSTRGSALGNYAFTKKRSQFGKLYVGSLNQLADLMDLLEQTLADSYEYLPIHESDEPSAPIIGRLQRVQFDVGTSETLDVPITVRYEVIQYRTQEAEAPPATVVVTDANYEGGLTDDA